VWVFVWNMMFDDSCFVSEVSFLQPMICPSFTWMKMWTRKGCLSSEHLLSKSVRLFFQSKVLPLFSCDNFPSQVMKTKQWSVHFEVWD
jgi:hypothetical protein